MRLGLIVDGVAEYRSIKTPVERAAIPGLTIIGPVLTKMTPLAPAKTFAAECRKQMCVLESRHVEQIVVIVDREGRQDPCQSLAEEYSRCLNAVSSTPTVVVLKNTMYENWLIADVEALKAQPARFKLTAATARRITPNKADSVDALALLRQIAIGTNYSKVQDAARIMERADAGRIAANSRSFRRLLRVLGHPDYVSQSRNP